MPDPHWNEARTRKELIDKLLKKDGWGSILPFGESKKCSHGAVEEYSTTSGPADYLLFNKNRAIAAVVGKVRDSRSHSASNRSVLTAGEADRNFC
jgi:type I site-specific restriction endonuclease